MNMQKITEFDSVEQFKELTSEILDELREQVPGIWHESEGIILEHISKKLHVRHPEVYINLSEEDVPKPSFSVETTDDDEVNRNIVFFQVAQKPDLGDVDKILTKVQEITLENMNPYAYAIVVSIGELPVLPEYDQQRVGFMQVHGWTLKEPDSKDWYSL